VAAGAIDLAMQLRSSGGGFAAVSGLAPVHANKLGLAQTPRDALLRRRPEQTPQVAAINPIALNFEKCPSVAFGLLGGVATNFALRAPDGQFRPLLVVYSQAEPKAGYLVEVSRRLGLPLGPFDEAQGLTCFACG